MIQNLPCYFIFTKLYDNKMQEDICETQKGQ